MHHYTAMYKHCSYVHIFCKLRQLPLLLLLQLQRCTQDIKLLKLMLVLTTAVSSSTAMKHEERVAAS
jgi:hypothetical protein